MIFTPYLIVSAERPELDSGENAIRTETLRRQLTPYNPIALRGHYDGSDEVSFMVMAPEDSDTANAVERLAWHWEQQSVMYIDSAKYAYLVFRDGSRRELGPVRDIDPNSPAAAYTDIPNGRRVAA